MDYYSMLQQSYKSTAVSENEKIVVRNSDTNYISGEDVIRLYRVSKGQISQITRLSSKEEALYNKVKRGERYFYNLYMYKLGSTSELVNIEKSLKELYKENTFLHSVFCEYENNKIIKIVTYKTNTLLSIQDISMRSKIEKSQILENFISNKRMQIYEPDKRLPLYINFFKVENNEIVCFVTICEKLACDINKDKILEELFGITECEELQLDRGIKKETWVNTLNYWQKALIPLPANVNRIQSKNDIETSIYALDNDIVQTLKKYCDENDISMKSMFMSIWGLMYCKYMDRKNVMIGDIHVGGKLTLVPVKVNRSNVLIETIQEVQEQVENSHIYDGCTLVELENKLYFETSKLIPIIHNCTEKEDMGVMLAYMIPKKLYQLHPINMPVVPLLVSYNLISVIARVKYTYDKEVYKDIDVEKLHACFVSVLESFAKNIDEGNIKDEKCEIVQDKKTTNDKMKLTAQKALYMKKSKIFGSFMIEELLKLAEKSKLIYLQMGDEVVKEEKSVKYLYIVGDGKIEVSKTDMEGYVKNLQILKAGDIFGIESVLKAAISQNTYAAYGELVKLIAIPVEEMKQIVRLHPEIMQELLEIQFEQTSKFQRLWLLE